MYRVDIATGDEFLPAATAAPPFGPGFSTDIVAQADTLEMWGSSLTDPGDDFVEYRLLKEGQVVQAKRFAGY